MYSISFAQPVLTATGINPIIGTTFSYTSTSFFNQGAAGASQTWNFGSITGTAGNPSVCVAPSSTPQGANFPNANISFNSGGSGTYAYQKTSSSAYQNYGNVTSTGVIMPFSNPEDLLRFPFTFNNTYTDPWAVSFVNGGYTWYRTGTTTVTADGYGTLIIPSGTINNVTRIHFVQVYQDSVDLGGFPYIITYNNDEYMWYADGTHTAIAASYTLTTSGSSSSSGGFYLTNTVGVNDINKFISAYDIYPNPASDQIKLDFTLSQNKNVEVRLFNSLGEKLDVFERKNGIQGLNTIQMDISTLPKGIYFAQILLEGNIAQTKRFVVSK